jgi:RNA polymerase sigma factor (sigma-70 family)
MNRENLESVLCYVRNLVGLPGEDRIPDEELVRRYVESRDETTFAALIRRYGPAVLRVCFRVLQRSHDAEDAFQATFLVLAQEAESLRRQASVGAWLYEVAYHVALRARRRMARQRQREGQRISLMANDDPEEHVLRKDAQAALDEELHHLPEKYRRPLVLCDLLSRTHEQAAWELGLDRSTLTKRLKRAHGLLRQRLVRRGIGLSMGALVLLLREEAVACPVPSELLLPTVRTAAAVAWGRSVATSETVAALAAKGYKGLPAARLKITRWLVAAALLLGGGSWAMYARVVPPPEASPAVPPSLEVAGLSAGAIGEGIDPPASESDADAIALSGRVLNARGAAVPGAHVVVCGRRAFRPGKLNVRDEILARTRTDGAGRFRLTVCRPSSAWSLRTRFVQLWAASPGQAPVTHILPWRPKAPPVEVRLLPPDVIRGRLVDESGRPAAAVRVVVYQVGSVRLEPIQGLDPELLDGPALWPAAVTTGADGSFALHGLNLKHGVRLRVSDDRYALRKAFLTPSLWDGRVGTLTLGSARILEGRVTAADTGKVLPGARLSVMAWDEASVTTDSAIDARADSGGIFRVRLPAGESYRVEAFAPNGLPYLGVRRVLRWPAGSGRHELEVALPRGTLIRGAVTDADSGEPVSGAHIQFLPLEGSVGIPSEVLTGLDNLVTGGTDGAFRLVVPPVAGHLLVHEPSGDYVTEEMSTCPRRNDRAGSRLYAQRVLPLEPVPGREVHEVRVILRRGVRVTGWVFGPDGEPVKEGAWLCRGRTCPQEPAEGQPQPFWDGRFTLRGCVPGRVYPVLFLDAKCRLGALAELTAGRGEEKRVEVRLKPCGEAVVHFVDPRGRPVAGHMPFLYVMVPPDQPGDEEADDGEGPPAEMHELDEFDLRHYQKGPYTDASGRVTLPALIPGVRYRMDHYMDADGGWREFEAAAGQTLSLPNVTIKRPR